MNFYIIQTNGKLKEVISDTPYSPKKNEKIISNPKTYQNMKGEMRKLLKEKNDNGNQ